mgnify:FL=1
MSWVKNGLLLATGGIIGLCVAAAIEADDDGAERSSEGLRDVDGIVVLGEKLRREAEWAMEECTSDEERDAVYAEIKTSIGALQEKLAERGAEIIAELEAQFAEEGKEEERLCEQPVQTKCVQNIREVLDELAQSMDKTLKGLQPVKATV